MASGTPGQTTGLWNQPAFTQADLGNKIVTDIFPVVMILDIYSVNHQINGKQNLDFADQKLSFKTEHQLSPVQDQ